MPHSAPPDFSDLQPKPSYDRRDFWLRVLLALGGVLLLCVIAAVVLGIRFLYRISPAARRITNHAAVYESQQAELRALGRLYPFGKLPADGAPPAEKRFADYLSVRRKLRAADYIAQSTYEAHRMMHPDSDPHTPEMDAERAKLTLDAIVQVRVIYIRELREMKMSPREYEAMTEIFCTHPPDTLGGHTVPGTMAAFYDSHWEALDAAYSRTADIITLHREKDSIFIIAEDLAKPVGKPQ